MKIVDKSRYEWVFALRCNKCKNTDYFIIENIWKGIAYVIKNKGRHSCSSCKKTGEVNIHLIKYDTPQKSKQAKKEKTKAV